MQLAKPVEETYATIGSKYGQCFHPLPPKETNIDSVSAIYMWTTCEIPTAFLDLHKVYYFLLNRRVYVNV